MPNKRTGKIHHVVKAALITATATASVGLLTYYAQSRRNPPPATTTQSREPSTARLPLSLTSQYFPSGWMGDGEEGTKYLATTEVSETIRGDEKVARKFVYRSGGPEGWAGVYWQHPNKNWGAMRGLDLTGARSITFLARGEKGGEIVEFFTGGLAQQPKVSLGPKVLSKDWQAFEIGIDNLNLTNVVGAFAWSASAPAKGGELTFYVADLQIQ